MKEILFNYNWLFSKEQLSVSWDEIKNEESRWQPVDIPHDWLIHHHRDLYETSSGWYRKSFLPPHLLPGEKLTLRFEGVYMDSTLYVNGQKAGEWKYGYSTFELNITPFLQVGENLLVLKVLHQSPNSRWYSGAGIYRNVWLRQYPRTHIASDGIYLSTVQKESDWVILADTETCGPAEGVVVKHQILDHQGTMVEKAESPATSSGTIDRQEIGIRSPRLWDIKDPYLYRLRTELWSKGELQDSVEQPFGFRSIEFTPDRGFLLNGRNIKLNGVCLHHDLGCLGAAVNRSAIDRQLRIMQEMGVNAIRTAHNMPSVELMELADQRGMLICSESFDMWENPKTTYDYARFFPDWHEKDVASWIRRDRNHPSIIMWCIGNEISDTHLSERGQEITRRLKDLVEQHDPRGNAPVTIGSNYMPWEGAQACAEIVKLAGYNYAEKLYKEHHQQHPDWCIYGSETSSIVQSRGVYHFPASRSILADDDLQCSSLGNSRTSWGSKSVESCIIAERDTPFSAGQFLWSGFDYIGEPTPYHTRNSYFGQVDTCGFPKDAFYIYQAEWTDYRTNPMVHIFPYWDFNEGQLIDIRVCSNAPRIELFFNGKSQGDFKIDHINGAKLLGEWQLPYKKGELTALAYDEAGREIARASRRSFTDAVALVLKTEKTSLLADGQDLCYVEVSAQDCNGNPVENANHRVEIAVEGAGRLLGLDNGDSTDGDSYKGSSKRLFSGKLLAVIAADREPGEIHLRASSPGLEPATLRVQICEVPGAIGERSRPLKDIGNRESVSNKGEIPLRKIELSCREDRKFHPGCKEMTVTAECFPADSSYRDLHWRVCDDAGIDSNMARVEAQGSEAILHALGDGTFRLRCMSRNGTNHMDIISELEFSIEGLGPAYLNPYNFISGGLYSRFQGELTNGNERGVATPRDHYAWAAFEKLDFGPIGSNTITLSLFVLDSEPFHLEIWDGIPESGEGKKLGDFIYQKPSIWNTYQEDTFTLPERLRGVHSLTLCTKRKAHIKGFLFTPLEKAYLKLSAADHDSIYGDSFNEKKDAIEGIGNNVTLEFNNMDFGEPGCSRLSLNGRSPEGRNSIQVRFTKGGEEHIENIEFPHSREYQTLTFPFAEKKGNQKVCFIFLPGCNFDFRWFQFLKQEGES